MINTLPKSLIDAASKILEESYKKIYEMAMPTKEIGDTTFYHGTYNREPTDHIDHIVDIARNGIRAPDNTNKKENNLTPVHGMTYSTPHIGYAQMYAIGGDFAGSSTAKMPHGHSHGYIFSFRGKKLTDIQPDEDSVGEIYANGGAPDYVNSLATKHTSNYTRKRAKEGEYDKFAKIGKSVLPYMSDEQKLDFINKHNPHIANKGTIIPDRVYRIHQSKIPLLKKDGSNFFDHAEELDMEKLKEGQAVVRRKRKPL